MKNPGRSLLIILLIVLVNGANGQSWKQSTETEWEFDMSRYSILMILYEGFNYDEAFDITGYWKLWGAKIDIAGTLPEQHGERNNPATQKVHDEIPVTVKPDLNIEEVDLQRYDLIYFPGGEGVQEFNSKYHEKIREIIDKTVSRGKYVAAICHSPYLLSSSELLKGHSITVQGNEFKTELQKAGAKIINDIFVADRNFLTGQWPYFETFGASVAQELTGSIGTPISWQQPQVFYPNLQNLGNTRNVWYMKDRAMPEDTLKMIIRKCINPQLPFEMMNNNTLRIIAVRDTSIKSLLADEIVKASREKYVQENLSETAMKKVWYQILNAPYLIFVYNDLSDLAGIKDENERALNERIYTVLAGESISQLIFSANSFGYGTSTLGGMRTFVAEEGFRKILGLSPYYQLENIITVGIPAEFSNPPVARPLSEYLLIK
jgi:protease I